MFGGAQDAGTIRWRAQAGVLRVSALAAVVLNPVAWVTDLAVVGLGPIAYALLALRVLAGVVHVPIARASVDASPGPSLQRMVALGFACTVLSGVIGPAVLRPTSVASQGGPLLLIIILYGLAFPPWRRGRITAFLIASGAYVAVAAYWRGQIDYAANQEIYTTTLFLVVVSVLVPRVTERIENTEDSMAEAQRELQRSVYELLAEVELREQREEALRHAQAEAEAANSAKSQFLANVSHELRTPLTAINGSLALLELAAVGPEERTSLLDVCRRNSKRLLGLVNALLDLQAVDAGEFRVEPREVALAQVLGDCERASAGLATHYGVRFAFDPCPAARVSVDPPRIQQVLANLLSNAAKHSPDGEVVTVHSEVVADGSRARVSVRDRGEGIPEAFRANVFRRFAMADGDYKGGTGLGLAITKALVEAHDGSVGFDSEPGQGATFWFELPLVDATP